MPNVPDRGKSGSIVDLPASDVMPKAVVWPAPGMAFDELPEGMTGDLPFTSGAYIQETGPRDGLKFGSVGPLRGTVLSLGALKLCRRPLLPKLPSCSTRLTPV